MALSTVYGHIYKYYLFLLLVVKPSVVIQHIAIALCITQKYQPFSCRNSFKQTTLKMGIALYLLNFIITLAAVIYYGLKKRLNYWKDRDIPHNKPSLLMGNFEGVMKTRSVGEIYRDTYRKFKGSGPFCGFYFQQKPIVVLLDMEMIKNVLIKDFSKFSNRGLYHNEDDDPLSGHLFLLDGQKWRTLRNKLSPTFTSGKMKFMYPSIIRVAEEFVETFEQHMIEMNHEVEIKDLLARFTTDIIGSCAFGIECNSLKNPQAEFRVLGRSIFTERRNGKFMQLFINTFPDLARKLHVRMVTDKVHNFFMCLVKETVEYRKKNNIKRNDFLNILLELNDSEQVMDEQGNYKGLTLEEMAAQMFVFFVGGFETSSSTMGYALYELALNQSVQQRLRDEVNQVYLKEGEFTYESIKNMQYLNAVISGGY